MLYREIIAVCSEIHTEHINTLCGQNVALLSVKPGGTYSGHWNLEVLILWITHFHRIMQTLSIASDNKSTCYIYYTHLNMLFFHINFVQLKNNLFAKFHILKPK
jgi:hypothetical protein